MKKRVKAAFYLALAIVFSCLLSANSWASPFEFLPYPNSIINLGIYAEIEGASDRFDGDTPQWGENYVYDSRTSYAQTFDNSGLEAWRNTSDTWDFGYQLADDGFTIFSNMTLTTSYIYEPGFDPMTDPGYAYAFSGYDGGRLEAMATLAATAETPPGTIIPFTIQFETLGTPWEVCEWEFTVDGVTVNQDNYDQVIFYLMAGETYTINFGSPYLGLQTQSIVDGSLESGFNFHFTQVPVPIPGAVWLLGSGLAGLIGMKRKYWN